LYQQVNNVATKLGIVFLLVSLIWSGDVDGVDASFHKHNHNHNTPANNLAVLDIVCVILICFVTLCVENRPWQVIQCIEKAHLPFTVFLPAREQLRRCITLLGLILSTYVYVQAAADTLHASDTLLPGGSFFGYCVLLRMITTVTVPLIDIYPQLKYRQLDWILMPVLLVSSTYMLSLGVCLMLICHMAITYGWISE